MTATDRPSAWSDDSVPRHSAVVADQRARDRHVILNIVTGRYYTLEGAGDSIWALADGHNTVAAIVSAVCQRYGTDAPTARRDAIELLEELAAEGLVESA